MISAPSVAAAAVVLAVPSLSVSRRQPMHQRAVAGWCRSILPLYLDRALRRGIHMPQMPVVWWQQAYTVRRLRTVVHCLGYMPDWQAASQVGWVCHIMSARRCSYDTDAWGGHSSRHARALGQAAGGGSGSRDALAGA